jgi:SAM-dependent methyltransferase
MLAIGDARHLPLADGTVALICAHPPYADAIRYSPDLPGDLSHLPVEAFLDQLATVAAECRRVLRPGGVCAVLVGDLRQRGAVVPLGFETLRVFQAAGLGLQEIAIKAQHHTRTAAQWAPVAAERGFLLLAHEYLFILGNPHGAGTR